VEHEFLLTAWVFLPDHWHAVSYRRLFENHCAEGALECGGLTPPWNRHGAGITQSAMYEGGVKPPHSKALRAFAWFLGRVPTKFPNFFRIFRLTSPRTYDSLLLWSYSGHFVAVGRRGAPRRKGKRKVPAMGECRELQKMKNSGNEAKKYLKTKHITSLSTANCVRFARKLAQNRA